MINLCAACILFVKVVKYFVDESGMDVKELVTSYHGKDKSKTALDYTLQSINPDDNNSLTDSKYKVTTQIFEFRKKMEISFF